MKNNLPVVILKEVVLLPNCDIRIEFDNDYHKSILDVSELFHDNQVLVVIKENELEETDEVKKLPKIGIIAKISHKMELPNGKVRLILTGIQRAKVIEYLTYTDTNLMLESITQNILPEKIEKQKEEFYIKKLKEEVNRYIELVPYASNSILSSFSKEATLEQLTDIVAFSLSLSKEKMLVFLNEEKASSRLEMLLSNLYVEKESFKLEKELEYLKTEVRAEISERIKVALGFGDLSEN